MAGVLLIPFSVGTALFGVISGFLAARVRLSVALPLALASTSRTRSSVH